MEIQTKCILFYVNDQIYKFINTLFITQTLRIGMSTMISTGIYFTTIAISTSIPLQL